MPLAHLAQLGQPVATGMATKGASQRTELEAISTLVDLATSDDLGPREVRALTTALTALGGLRTQRAAEGDAHAGQQLVNDLASIYSAIVEEARVAEKRAAEKRAAEKRAADRKRRASCTREATRPPGAKKKSALRFGRTAGAEARLGRTVFKAVSDAIGDWSRDTGHVDHDATTQWALEELELDAAEIKDLQGPLNAAASVVGRLGIVPPRTTFDRRHNGVRPLEDPEEPVRVVGVALRQLRQIEFVLMSLGFSERTARDEALRLLSLRWVRPG